MLGVLLDALASQPVAAVLLAAALTWAAHSSVAVVVLVMSLASHDMVNPALAFALVLGANLGTAINPMIEGVTGDDPAARRLPLGNLLTRVARRTGRHHPAALAATLAQRTGRRPRARGGQLHTPCSTS